MSNQVFQGLVNSALGISGFDLQMFTIHIELRSLNSLLQFGHGTQLIFSGFILLITDNFLHALRKAVGLHFAVLHICESSWQIPEIRSKGCLPE